MTHDTGQMQLEINFSNSGGNRLRSALNCGEFVLPHNACKACGKYRGRDVIAVD